MIYNDKGKDAEALRVSIKFMVEYCNNSVDNLSKHSDIEYKKLNAFLDGNDSALNSLEISILLSFCGM